MVNAEGGLVEVFSEADASAMLDGMRRERFAHIPFGLEDSFLKRAQDSFNRFTELPAEITHQFDSSYRFVDQHRGSSSGKDAQGLKGGTLVGYIEERGGKRIFYGPDVPERAWDPKALDEKVYFHYRPRLGQVEPKIDHPVLREFLFYAGEVWKHASKTAKQVLSVLSKEYSEILPHHYLNPETGEPGYTILRFLRYNSPTPASSARRRAVVPEGHHHISSGHVDKGLFTLALRESHKGLRVGEKISGSFEDEEKRERDGNPITPEEVNQKLRLIEREHGKIVVFGAPSLETLSSLSGDSDKIIRAGFHDVIQEIDPHQKVTCRDATVLFFGSGLLGAGSGDNY